jgi:hypothetical protein
MQKILEPGRVIFLDIDGVLNQHRLHENGYCGIDPACVKRLNRLLRQCPDAGVVISSTWRYRVFEGEMTLAGLESLLLTHGLCCEGKVVGVTAPDDLFVPPAPATGSYQGMGMEVRAMQIRDYLVQHPSIHSFVVLDDLEIDIPNLVRTDGDVGLTAADAECAVRLLQWQDL